MSLHCGGPMRRSMLQNSATGEFLTDADVKDKDADGVRAAAVARKYPGAAKHLDQKPVLDSMWLAIVDAAGKVPVAPAANVAQQVVAQRVRSEFIDQRQRIERATRLADLGAVDGD